MHRTHNTQLTKQQKRDIRNRVQQGHGFFSLTPHAAAELAADGFDSEEVFEAVESYDAVVEVNNNAGDVRAVVRRNGAQRAICAVVSLLTFRIVTVWGNDTEDNHSTLRAEEYDGQANLNW